MARMKSRARAISGFLAAAASCLCFANSGSADPKQLTPASVEPLPAASAFAFDCTIHGRAIGDVDSSPVVANAPNVSSEPITIRIHAHSQLVEPDPSADNIISRFFHAADSLQKAQPQLRRYAALDAAMATVMAPALRDSTARLRRNLLARASTWYTLRLRSVERNIIIVYGLLTILPMLLFGHVGPWRNDRQHVRLGGTNIWALMAQDFAPIAYDAHISGMQITGYRGAIHWFRDAAEKMLALALVAVFYVFLTKATAYVWYYLTGEAWRLVFLPVDINIALALGGWALIIDGFIHISAMVDAPGVSRTLDSIIVILAGFIIMGVEAGPGTSGLVSFSLGETKWHAPVLGAVVALLFCTRELIHYVRGRSNPPRRGRVRIFVR